MEINDTQKGSFDIPIIIHNIKLGTKENTDNKKENLKLKEKNSNLSTKKLNNGQLPSRNYNKNDLSETINSNKRQINYTNNDYSNDNSNAKNPQCYIPAQIHNQESLPSQAIISDYTIKNDSLSPMNLENLYLKKKIKNNFYRNKKTNIMNHYRTAINNIKISNETLSKRNGLIKRNISTKTENSLITKSLFLRAKNIENERKMIFITKNNSIGNKRKKILSLSRNSQKKIDNLFTKCKSNRYQINKLFQPVIQLNLEKDKISTEKKNANKNFKLKNRCISNNILTNTYNKKDNKNNKKIYRTESTVNKTKKTINYLRHNSIRKILNSSGNITDNKTSEKHYIIDNIEELKSLSIKPDAEKNKLNEKNNDSSLNHIMKYNNNNINIYAKNDDSSLFFRNNKNSIHRFIPETIIVSTNKKVIRKIKLNIRKSVNSENISKKNKKIISEAKKKPKKNQKIEKKEELKTLKRRGSNLINEAILNNKLYRNKQFKLNRNNFSLDLTNLKLFKNKINKTCQTQKINKSKNKILIHGRHYTKISDVLSNSSFKLNKYLKCTKDSSKPIGVKNAEIWLNN